MTMTASPHPSSDDSPSGEDSSMLTMLETLKFVADVKKQAMSTRSSDLNQAFDDLVLKMKDAKYPGDSDRDGVAALEVMMKDFEKDPRWRGRFDTVVSKNSRTLEQAKIDPLFPVRVTEQAIESVNQIYRVEKNKFSFGLVYSRLVDEWITCQQTKLKGGNAKKIDGSNSPSDGSSTGQKSETEWNVVKSNNENVHFQDEVDAQTKEFQSLVFEEKVIDVPGFETYLKSLIVKPDTLNRLDVLRSSVRSFADLLPTKVMGVETMKSVISSVVQLNLLTESKQRTLEEFSRNEDIVKELVGVMNTKLSSIESWAWPKEGVMIEPRRHLNGKWRFFLDVEILSCLLLHYVGALWGTHFRSELLKFHQEDGVSVTKSQLTREQAQRRRTQIVDTQGSRGVKCLREKRSALCREHYFLTQLPESVTNLACGDTYNEDRTSREASVDQKFDSPEELTQSLLHILSTDILLNKTLHGGCAVFRTDIEWFGPSLPIQTIKCVLEFFGMPTSHVDFFVSFLSIPLKFKGDEEPRSRKRGLPVVYLLSAVCGELTLYLMDLAVSQATGGILLFRKYDDFWCWDKDAARCATAWSEMNKFANLAGLKFNQEKTGSVQIGDGIKPVSFNSDLPAGEVRWGFLVMDKTDGRFRIDQKIVDEQISDLKIHLTSATGVFEFIQILNKFMNFFVRNCGMPSEIFGSDHIDDVINSILRLRNEIFCKKSVRDTVLDKVISVMTKIQGSQDEIMDTATLDSLVESLKNSPEGWVYWPTEAGGLGVIDHIAEMMTFSNSFRQRIAPQGKRPEDIIAATLRDEKTVYDTRKERWAAGHDDTKAEFMSFEEFMKGREDSTLLWTNAFDLLVSRPERKCKYYPCDSSDAMFTEFAKVPYWDWMLSLHEESVKSSFGSLVIADPAIIPTAVANILKKARSKWE